MGFDGLDWDALEQLIGQNGARALQLAMQVWNMPIASGADGKAVVTIGTIVCGVTLFGCGYLAARFASRWVGRKLLSRFRLSRSDVAPVQSLTFYVLLAMSVMLSLNVLHVPLTVFSFLGGALAIGAGFGSQNIVNNFISGLILLVERPIRVGDVIELDGKCGKVTEIGARSTRIANGLNHEIIVPNSKILETSVVNWTLSNDIVGCALRVGAAHGSPTREVERLLMHAAQSHPEILKEPAPSVVFADFGPDALHFELRFSLRLHESSKSKVESELRFAIDESFANRGLVIAYPQRDVHLNVLRPVEVRLAQPQVQLKAVA